MRYIDLPAKVISGLVTASFGSGLWPYDDGRGDPYWAGGSTPRDYRWVVDIDVTIQPHSSHRTRRPFVFDGTDISVGDYIADQQDGITVQIVSVLQKSPTFVRCLVEDTLRYNTFRDQSSSGRGIFQTPSSVIIFQANESGLPVLDPIPPGGVGASFYANLMSRFQNFEETVNFLLHKPNHGFSVDDLISADPATNSFVKTDPSHPFIVGTVSFLDLGPDYFMVNPLQKVEQTFPSLPGDVGDVLYASPTEAGEFSLAGQIPVLLKLRNNTKTRVTGTILSASTTAGNAFMLNRVQIDVGDGSASAVVAAINTLTEAHGVVASELSDPTETSATEGYFYGEPAFDRASGSPPTATINGVQVTFSTMDAGQAQYGAPYALEEDMAADINAANIPGVSAVAEGNILKLISTLGDIVIVNGTPDAGGVFFAGPSSATGIPLTTAASTASAVHLEAIDARPIDLFDVVGAPCEDFGLVSVENGVKAAAMFIEQGIRQASTYVVATIAARDAINALFGDQCFVQDKGNGEWAHYVRTLDNTWVKIADKDSSETDAQTVEIEITHETDITDVIYTVSGGSRVTFVTVTVTEQFNGLNPTFSVGDADDNARLMTEDQNDLTSLGAYSTTPSYIYSGSQDVDITFTFDAANSTSGKAVIAISYT